MLEQHFNKNSNMCCGHELRRYCTKPNRSGINRNHSKLQKCDVTWWRSRAYPLYFLNVRNGIPRDEHTLIFISCCERHVICSDFQF